MMRAGQSLRSLAGPILFLLGAALLLFTVPGRVWAALVGVAMIAAGLVVWTRSGC